jgi:hypothetical protein
MRLHIGRLVVVDLTDPLLSSDEANGIFQVLSEQFRAITTSTGKILLLDEAHKYMNGEAADGLSDAIVDIARLMRHDGTLHALVQKNQCMYVCVYVYVYAYICLYIYI